MVDTQSPQTGEQVTEAAFREALASVIEDKCSLLIPERSKEHREVSAGIRAGKDATVWLHDVVDALARLTAAARQPEAMADQSTEARLRELIARIVDPDAFDALGGVLSNVKAAEAHRKADAIATLSLTVQDTSDELTRLRAEVEAMRESLQGAVDDSTGKPNVWFFKAKDALARTTLNGEQANGG